MPKRILVFANSRYPYGAANSVNVFRMTAAFNTLDYDVTLYSLRSSSLFKKGLWKETCRRFGTTTLTKIRTHLLWWPFLRGAEPFLAFVALCVLIFKNRHSIIFTRVRYVAVVARILGFRAYFESHSPPLSFLQVKIDRWLLRSEQVQLIGISEGLRNAYLNLKLEGRKIKVAPDAGRIHRTSLPHEEEFHGPALDIGYIGSLLPGRGIELIMTLAQLSPHRRFHIVGKDPKGVHSANGHPFNVVFYDEVTPQQAERIPLLFDVLLMPYQKQVFIGNGIDTSAWMSPMKMFEFMLSGRPIIASRLSAICEILEDIKEALLVEPADEQAWDKALKQTDDPKLRWFLAVNAYRKASEKHTWEIRARSILESIHDK